VAAGLAGYFGPSLALDHLVSARQERLKLSLPDALDLMVVCVEAGLVWTRPSERQRGIETHAQESARNSGW